MLDASQPPILESARRQIVERIHNHYLKSTLYCGECGYRMGPQLPGISQGNPRKYFTCWGRHGKHADCTMKYIPMEYAEQLVQELHDRISLTPEYRKTLEGALRRGLREIHQDTEEERTQLRISLEKPMPKKPRRSSPSPWTWPRTAARPTATHPSI